MAKEKIIEIKTGPAVKSIQDLKNNISAYKDKLKDLEIGSKEYQDTLVSLQENQAALRNAMYGTTASMEELTKASKGLTADFGDLDQVLAQTSEKVSDGATSYNELVRVMAQLKEAWRSTTDETERSKLGEAINSVNDRLKGLDETVGVFGRNVGNYIGAVDHLTQGLASMGGGASRLVGPLKNVTTGLKTMSATPAVAILGILATVLQKVIDAMHSGEENTNALTKALAPFQAIGDAVTRMLQGMAKALVPVVEWFGKLTSAIFGNNKAAEERLKLAEQEAALAQSQRENLVKNAEAERDIAELRAKASEKDKYTASERLAFLEEAGRKEAEIADRARKEAEDAYIAMKTKLSLTKSTKEELDALARAEADMIKADTAYYNTLRTINSGITSARKEEAKSARDAAKAVKDAATAKINAEKEYLQQLLGIVKDGSDSQLAIQNEIAARERDKAKAEARQKITDRKELDRSLALIDKSYLVQLQKNQQEHDNKMLAESQLAIANRRDAFQRGSVEYAAIQVEYAKAVRDGMRRQMDETDAEFKARRMESQRAVIEAQAALNDAVLKETTDGLKAQMAAVREGSVEQLQLALQVAKAELDGIYQGIDESLDEFNARRLGKEKEVSAAETSIREAEIERDRTILEQRIATMQEGSLEYLAAAVEQKQFELDTLHQLEDESDEAFRLRQLEAEKAHSEALKNLWKGRVNVVQQASSAMSGLLDSIADALEANTEGNLKEAEKAKNLRIASATIEMLTGAVGAFAQAAGTIPPPYGPILGAINAAAVVATGIANIAKIKSQKISTGSASSQTPTVPASVDAPTVTPTVREVRNITGASEEERLDRMASDQRVYILSSDLEADANSRHVAVAETTF